MLRRLRLTNAIWHYIQEVSVCESHALRRLREETACMPLAEMQVPPEQGQFLAFLAQLIGARRTLDIGTFTGYSALWVASVLPSDGRVVACDIREDWGAIARRHWTEAGMNQRIDLRIGPAVDTLRKLLQESQADTFDLAFIDADKPNYGVYFELAFQLGPVHTKTTIVG